MVILVGIEVASETGILCAGKPATDSSSNRPAAFLKCLPAIPLDHVGDCVGLGSRVVMPRKSLDETVSLAEQFAECCDLCLQVCDAHRGHGIALDAGLRHQLPVAFDFVHQVGDHWSVSVGSVGWFRKNPRKFAPVLLSRCCASSASERARFLPSLLLPLPLEAARSSCSLSY